jgi:hypothetical protein
MSLSIEVPTLSYSTQQPQQAKVTAFLDYAALPSSSSLYTSPVSTAPLTASTSNQIFVGGEPDHKGHVFEGLFIGLIVLVGVLLLGLVLWLLLRYHKRSQTQLQTAECNATATQESVEIGSWKHLEPKLDTSLTHARAHQQPSDIIHSPLSSDTQQIGTALELPRKDEAIVTDKRHESSPSAAPLLLAPRRGRKPAPLTLYSPPSHLTSPVSAIAKKSNPSIVVDSAVKSYSPALVEARRRLEEQRGWNMHQQSSTSDGKTPSIMAAVAAASQTFQPSGSYSPPITAPGSLPPQSSKLTNALDDHGSSEHGEGAQWAEEGTAISSIASAPSRTRLSGMVTPEADYSPVRHHSNLVLPISATPPGLFLARRLHDHSKNVESVDSLSASPGLATAAPQSRDLLRVPAGSCLASSSSKRNSFGIEEDKKEENQPSSAPASGASNRLLQLREHNASSVLSDEDDGREVCGQSRKDGLFKSGLSASTTSNQHSTSTLSLRSSILRAQKWLNGPESPTAPISYSFL